jgi:uncharacterized membrane protein
VSDAAPSLLPLFGVALVIRGFDLRLNTALVVVGAGFATALLAGIEPVATLELIGSAFVRNRYLVLFLLTLPVIALLEETACARMHRR